MLISVSLLHYPMYGALKLQFINYLSFVGFCDSKRDTPWVVLSQTDHVCQVTQCRHVVLPTTANAAMLEVYFAAARHRKTQAHVTREFSFENDF